MVDAATAARAALVRARALACRRVGREIFRDLDLAVPAGGALVLRGPNGSGKSSLLRVLAGLLEAAAGTVELPADPDGGPGFHYIGHADPLKPGLTVEENLAFAAALTGAADVEAGLAAFALTRLADAPARQLSSGQRRRLTLARLAAVRKPVWLLDEPAVGLDAANRDRLVHLIAAHRGAGGAVLAATHGDIALPDAAALDLGR